MLRSGEWVWGLRTHETPERGGDSLEGGGGALPSSEVEICPRGHVALERGGDPPEGARGPRAWRRSARGGI
jgi:hypothetical protein